MNNFNHTSFQPSIGGGGTRGMDKFAGKGRKKYKYANKTGRSECGDDGN
jgi:hypothetical protein